MTLFFSHGVFFIAHKIHRIHKSAHVTLVLASGMCELNEDEYEDENCLRGVCFNLTQKYRIPPNKFALIFAIYE